MPSPFPSPARFFLRNHALRFPAGVSGLPCRSLEYFQFETLRSPVRRAAFSDCENLPASPCHWTMASPSVYTGRGTARLTGKGQGTFPLRVSRLRRQGRMEHVRSGGAGKRAMINERKREDEKDSL